MEGRGSPPSDRRAAAPGAAITPGSATVLGAAIPSCSAPALGVAIPSGSAPAASQSSAVMELPGLPSARVDAYRRYAYRRFYLRPQAVVRVLSMAELSAVAGIMPPIRRFLRWLG